MEQSKAEISHAAFWSVPLKILESFFQFLFFSGLRFFFVSCEEKPLLSLLLCVLLFDFMLASIIFPSLPPSLPPSLLPSHFSLVWF